jgi:thiol-disulfide isomerase/thioredoxin
MKKTYALALAAVSLILVGQGCAPIAPPAELPTAPPTADVMEKKDDAMIPKDDAMMEKEEGGMEPKGDAMMEKEGGGGAMMTEDEAEIAKDLTAPAVNPYYIAYSAKAAQDAAADGYATVLYFYAPWCPICRAEEPKLKGWIETSNLPIAGFRVDYDSEKDLKSKYGIPYQHTTVFLNAKGEEVERFSGPVAEAEFRAALAKAAGK